MLIITIASTDEKLFAHAHAYTKKTLVLYTYLPLAEALVRIENHRRARNLHHTRYRLTFEIASITELSSQHHLPHPQSLPADSETVASKLGMNMVEQLKQTLAEFEYP